MEQKKSEKANLENKRTIFLEIGFVLALAVVLVAFEYKSYDKVEYSNIERTVDDTPEEIIPITEQKVKPPPPKPPPQVTIINVVEDDVDVEDDIEIDIEFDEDEEMAEFEFVVEEEEIEEEQIFLVVENMPEFPGGEAAMYKFIGKNIEYPRMAKESGISGRVYVTFVVERDGSVTDVKILRGIGGGCDEEAVRVIKKMPRWSPGKQRGKPVRVQYRMPIKFTLQ
ncbi:MAG: energy transducer TonB [Bacteroidetes bacterium]|nr:MAG: energy transducer TonB [Bacteroidota bacterium]